MASRRWVGGTDGNVATAANYSGGVAPTAGDNVYCIDRPTNPMTSGTFPDLALFHSTANYDGFDIGSASGAPQFGSVTTMRLGHRGNAYINATGTVATLSAQMPNGNNLYLQGGTYTNTFVSRCRAVLGASAIGTNVYAESATFEAETNTNDITLVQGTGLIVLNNRDATTAKITGFGSTLVTKGITTIATADIAGGSTYSKQGSGTDTLVNLGPKALLTPKGNVTAAATVTTVVRDSSSTLVTSVPGFSLTVTNDFVIGYINTTTPGPES